MKPFPYYCALCKAKFISCRPLLYYIVLASFPTLVKSQCSASAVTHAGTVVNDNSIGALAFSNPGNGTIADGNRAAANVLLTLLNGNTYYLKASDFGFSLPGTYSICGVQVDIRKRAGGLGIGAWIQDNSVKLVKAGTVAGTDQAYTGVDWSGSDTYVTHGGSGQLWGTTLTPADINDPNFGVAISAKFNGLALVLPSAQVDDIRMTVYFSIPLPVHITSFDAALKTNNTAHIEWQTASEEDGESITLQRLQNGQLQWTDMITYPMHTATGSKTYVYDDVLAIKANYSYRLLIKGTGEQATYSKIARISYDGLNAFALYPNPARDFIIINTTETASSIKITDRSGQFVPARATSIAINKVQVDTRSLPTGIYYVVAGLQRFKFLKQ